MKVTYRPFHTGWCTEGRHRACPFGIHVTRKDKQGTYEKHWSCHCDCHKEATDE